jgi:hypothetical protein
MNGLSMMRSPSRTLVVLVLAVVAWAVPAQAEGDSGIRWTNGMPTEALRFNALSANPRANPRMVAQALRTANYALGTGDVDLREQLADPGARKFMEYTVSCALGPGQRVEWMDRAGNPYVFEGKLGLCPAWNTGPASLDCQRWVSACVLARNNAEGKRVLFSGRGNKPGPGPFIPKPQVETDRFQLYTRTPVASMVACDPFEVGVSRNCGFKPERVGQCNPGETVHLGAGGVPTDLTCGSAPLGETLEGTVVLRVCEGLNGCNKGLAALAESEGTCGTFQPAVSFTCPSTGVFSVVSGAWNSADRAAARVEVVNATYPASEEQIFSLREGGFYGNIFGPGALAPGVNVWVDSTGELHKDVDNVHVAGSIYPKMFACTAPGWTRADAYANERLCAVPGENCVAKVVGRCDATVTAGSYTGPRCQVDDATGHGDYGQCMDTAGAVYSQVVTPHLSGRCDNVSDPASCARDP